MIKISRNPNFTEWFNITLFGKVVDNARTHARAMTIASKLAKKHGVKAVTSSRSST